MIGNFTESGFTENNTLFYTLTSGEGDEDNSLFTVNGSDLQVSGALDFEAKDYCSIRVRVQDAYGASIEQVFRIDLLDDRMEDFDGDGLTETEEEDIYGTSDIRLDTDEDLSSDMAEIVAGSDPSNASSQPTLAVQKYTAGDGIERYGRSVALFEDYALIGASSINEEGLEIGSAHLRNIKTEEELFKFIPEDETFGANFGNAVALSAGYALIGAYP